MTRVGKVKVYTDEGKLIRHGDAREGDFGIKKVFGMFAPAELVRAFVFVVSVIITGTTVWNNINNHMTNQDRDFSAFLVQYKEHNNDETNFHQNIFRILNDKENRINCLAESIRGCCASSQNC